MTNTVGTIAFWPPEAIVISTDNTPDLDVDDMLDMDGPEAAEYSAIAADAWAAGITLHCLLYGVLPFPITGRGPLDIMKFIKNLDPFNTAVSICNTDGGEIGHAVDYNLRDEMVINEVWRNMLRPLVAVQDTTQEEAGSADGGRRKRWGVAEALSSSWVQSEVNRREETGQNPDASGTS